MSNKGNGRVKSAALASGAAPDAKGAAEGSEKPQDGQDPAVEGNAPEKEEGAGKPENEPEADLQDDDSGELDEEDDSDGDNEPVSGVTAEDLAAGQQKGRVRRMPATVPDIPDGHEAVSCLYQNPL